MAYNREHDSSFWTERFGKPSGVENWHLYTYEYLDDLHFMPPARDTLGDWEHTEALLEAIKNRFNPKGWSEEEEIQIMWLPPFAGAGPHDYFGCYVIHVKRYKGISWLISPYILPFHRLFQHADSEYFPPGESRWKQFDDVYYEVKPSRSPSATDTPAIFAEIRWRTSIVATSLLELDAILDSIDCHVRIHSPGLPQAIHVARANGDSLTIVLGEETDSILNFIAASGDPPYFSSLGNPSAEGNFTFYVDETHHSEAPACHVVSVSEAREAVREFVSQSSRLPKNITWAMD